MAVPETTSSSSGSMEQLLAELFQLVGELLLIRRPRVQTATAPAPPSPPPTANLHLNVTNDRCPFCPGGTRMKKDSRLIY